MSRLVDIDEVIKVTENTFPKEDVRKIAWVLCYTPTAYDVEKVVAELEESMNDAKNLWDDDEYYTGCANAFEQAIDIVKRGGAE